MDNQTNELTDHEKWMQSAPIQILRDVHHAIIDDENGVDYSEFADDVQAYLEGH